MKLLVCIFNFGDCKLHFSSITIHVVIVFKLHYLFAVGAKPFQQIKMSNTNIPIVLSTVLSKYSIFFPVVYLHHNNVMASQTTGVWIVCPNVCSGADQRKHQSPASLAFVREIHRSPGDSSHKGSATRKMFPFDDVIMRPGAHHKVLRVLVSSKMNNQLKQWNCNCNHSSWKRVTGHNHSHDASNTQSPWTNGAQFHS